MTFNLLNQLLEATDHSKREVYELQGDLIDQGWDDVIIDKKLVLKLVKGKKHIYLRPYFENEGSPGNEIAVWHGYDKERVYGDNGIAPDGTAERDEILMYTKAYLADLELLDLLEQAKFSTRDRVTIEPLGADSWAMAIKLLSHTNTGSWPRPQLLFLFCVHNNGETTYSCSISHSAENALRIGTSSMPSAAKLVEYAKAFRAAHPQ